MHPRSKLVDWVVLVLFFACQREAPPSTPRQTVAANQARSNTFAVPPVPTPAPQVTATNQLETTHDAAAGWDPYW